MKRLYLLILCVALAGAAFAQAPTPYEIEQSEKTDISKAVQIFPNPTTEFVNVKLEHINVDGVKVTIHNLIGNEINAETEKINDHELRIRVKDFDAGYYLLALKDENSNFKGIYKFVKR